MGREDVVDGRFEEDEVDIGAAVEKKSARGPVEISFTSLHVSGVAPVKVVRVDCRSCSVDEFDILPELSAERLVQVGSYERPPGIRYGAVLL